MATLSEMFEHLTETGSLFHPRFQMVIWRDPVHQVVVIYCMESWSWCYATAQEEVTEMVTTSRSATPGWMMVNRQVDLPAPGQAARCESCGWLFAKEHGYHEPGEYAYCADCCQW